MTDDILERRALASAAGALHSPLMRPDPEILAKLDQLIACPHCDALFRWPEVPDGGTARCGRCHAVLIAPRTNAISAIVSLALAALVMMIAAVSFPFLQLQASGLTSEASVIDTIRSYGLSSGLMAPLSALMAALIVILPALRLGGLIYALAPLSVDKPPARFATPAFRISMAMRPWAMAEIFIIGVAVALIKIAALATVSFGLSFWAFVLLVILTTAKDTLVCERTLWRRLARS